MANALDEYWIEQGCVKLNSCNKKLGAATFHSDTIQYVIKTSNNNNFNFCFLQPTFRPYDSNYGLNHKLQYYYQYQVLIKPFYGTIGKLYIESLDKIGCSISRNSSLTMKRSLWESSTLSAKGAGWECLINSVEVSQITFFNQICGLRCEIPTLEITYGLERIVFATTGKRYISNLTEVSDSFFNLIIYNILNALKDFKKTEQSLTFFKNNKYNNKLFLIRNILFNFVYNKLLKLIEIYNQISARPLKRVILRFLLFRIQRNLKLIIILFK
ncbi:MAG: glycine--tRNA ligase subunit alpha [Candidatus Hodgkinia cicadicola]